jgi:signal transduction histidine kinase
MKNNTINVDHDKIINEEILSLCFLATRYGTIITIILSIIYLFLNYDALFAPEESQRLLFIKISMLLVSVPICISTFFKSFKKYAKTLAFLSIFNVGMSLSFIGRVFGFDSYFFACFSFIFLAVLLMPWGLIWTIAFCLPIYLAYLIPALNYGLENLDPSMFVANNIFLVFNILMVCLISYFQYETRKKEILSRLTIQSQAEEIKKSELAKRQFIANVTHDLKTPLSIISGNIDKINSTRNQDEQIKPYIEAIKDSLIKSDIQLHSLISLSLFGSEENKPSLTLCKYSSVALHFCKQFSTQAEQKKLQYKLNSTDKDESIVHADISWIERILGNLILNSFKFTKDGDALTISIYSDEKYAWTEIIDTGYGITDEKLPYIFERKFQAHDDKKSEGHGLGLHIVKELLNEMKGDITVTSTINEGTSFKFFLPLCKNPSDITIDQLNKSSSLIVNFQKQIDLEIANSSIYANQNRFENNHPELPSILICEDTPGQLQLLIDCLSHEYNLFLAKNGKDGLQKLHNNADKISLIISDVKMPEMDGLEFCQHVFSEEQFKKIPFIFLTAYYNEHEQLIGIKNGATDYLQKPFNDAILTEKVNHWISRRESERVMEDLVTTLEQRTVTLSKLQAILEHEIRNPLMLLAFINKAIQKLAEKHAASANSDKKYWEQAGTLKNVIDSINAILVSSKSIEEQMKLNATKDEKIHSLFDTAIAQTTQYCQNIAIKIKIQHTVDENAVVKCDLKMLTQVFINIIRNATEAIKEKNIPDGTINIRTSIVNSMLSIEISDNGIGIPNEIKEKLFSYMYTTKKDGTGIGLYLSRKILRLHGGNIRIESKDGDGTRFIIEFPIDSVYS